MPVHAKLVAVQAENVKHGVVRGGLVLHQDDRTAIVWRVADGLLVLQARHDAAQCLLCCSHCGSAVLQLRAGDELARLQEAALLYVCCQCCKVLHRSSQ